MNFYLKSVLHSYSSIYVPTHHFLYFSSRICNVISKEKKQLSNCPCKIWITYHTHYQKRQMCVYSGLLFKNVFANEDNKSFHEFRRYAWKICNIPKVMVNLVFRSWNDRTFCSEILWMLFSGWHKYDGIYKLNWPIRALYLIMRPWEQPIRHKENDYQQLEFSRNNSMPQQSGWPNLD